MDCMLIETKAYEQLVEKVEELTANTGVIPYSSVGRKTYYKAAKIMAILTAHTNRTKF